MLLLALWAGFIALSNLRERNTGTAYFTLTTDVMGVQVGSIVTLKGFEIGHVTAVSLQTQGQGPQSAAELVFRVDFQIVAPVVFPLGETYLSIEEVNPVAPARLVIKQIPAMAAANNQNLAGDAQAHQVLHGCPAPAKASAELIAAGSCIPTLAVEEDMRPGLGGLIAAGTATLTTMEQTIREFGILGQEIRGSNARLAEMLSDKPGSLYRLPGALEVAADRVAAVTEQMHEDVVERVDRMVTPETIAALANAVVELEELIAATGHGSQETLENLAAITRTLNRITWELERDPIGFLRGSGGGTR